MLRLFFGFWFFVGLFSNQSEAATYRYSFDVIESKIGFEDEIKYYGNSEYNRLPWSPGERENYIRTYHSLGYMYGMTGRVIMDVTVLRVLGVGQSEASVTCVSVFCVLFRWGDSVHVRDDGLLVSDLWAILPPNTGGPSLYWYGGDLTLHRFSCSSPEHPDCSIELWIDSATFTIANFSRTDLTPVPLPATAPALAAGVLILGAVRMRRRARRLSQPTP